MTDGNNISLGSGPSIAGTAKADMMSETSHSSTASGIIKTMMGDVAVSLNPEIDPEIQNLLFTTICTNSELKLLYNLKFLETPRNFVFLSPEALSLELEIQSFLQELSTLPVLEDGLENQASQKGISSSKQSYPNSGTFAVIRPHMIHFERVDGNISKSESKNQGFLSHPDSGRMMETTTPRSIILPSVKVRTSEHTKINPSSITIRSPGEEILSETIEGQNHDSSLNKEGKQGEDKNNERDDSQNDEEEKQDHEDALSQIRRKKNRNNHFPSEVLTLQDLRYLERVPTSRTGENETKSQSFRKKSRSPLTIFADIARKPTTPKIKEEEGNVFIRFMRLMAKILGQAEAEAHELYGKIKGRTDDVDVLTLLTSKVNAEKGDIDWKNDEEMKFLLERAKEIGVVIADNKYTWTEDEKKLLKENIQMRKDSLEKITQLERTDMQRYLQESSQCHQARSNILKLLKEVIDTFVYNIRP